MAEVWDSALLYASFLHYGNLWGIGVRGKRGENVQVGFFFLGSLDYFPTLLIMSLMWIAGGFKRLCTDGG